MIIPIISEDIPLQQRDFDTNARLLFYITKITSGQYIHLEYFQLFVSILYNEIYTMTLWEELYHTICEDVHADSSSGLNSRQFILFLQQGDISNEDLCHYIIYFRDYYWRIDFISLLFAKLRVKDTDRVSAYSFMRLLSTYKIFQSISGLLSTVYAIFKQQQWPTSGPDLIQFEAYLNNENITTQAIVTYLTQDSTFTAEDFPNVPVIILFSPNTNT